MSVEEAPVPDPGHTRLRALVAKVGVEIAALPKIGDKSSLVRDWAQIVALLALGPEPETSPCQICGHHGMSKATLCGYCWTKLSGDGKVPITD